MVLLSLRRGERAQRKSKSASKARREIQKNEVLWIEGENRHEREKLVFSLSRGRERKERLAPPLLALFTATGQRRALTHDLTSQEILASKIKEGNCGRFLHTEELNN